MAQRFGEPMFVSGIIAANATQDRISLSRTDPATMATSGSGPNMNPGGPATDYSMLLPRATHGLTVGAKLIVGAFDFEPGMVTTASTSE